MASRRTRIKGIANIPQRRKPNITSNNEDKPSVNLEESEKSEDNNTQSNNLSADTENSVFQFEKDTTNNDSKIQEISRADCGSPKLTTAPSSTENDTQCISDNKPTGNSVLETGLNQVNSHNIENTIDESQNHKNDSVQSSDIKEVAETKPSKRLITKPSYRFIKPKPSINASRRLKLPNVRNEEENKESVKEPESSESTEQLCNTDKTFVAPSEIKETECTLDETHIMPQTFNSIPVESSEKGVKKLITSPVVLTDAEYPHPPQSPSKLNRTRIKAIPRFDQRRTSFSASESEDESRKHNRHRNDSVCSSASGMQDPISEIMSPQRPKEFNSVIQKKCKRTEQSRKLAEARREFQLKFGGNKPNRNKLTMIDLIFYNPTTNPMNSSKKVKKNSTSENTIDITEEVEEENSENVDNPEENKGSDENKESDDENDIPAPQIKIGPQGDIIIDEKSLVFETKETKKNRAELQQSVAINGDDNDRAYGIYKRVKRTRDWDQSETLRFYKALNTIGTDFTLMCDLFPNRTRRELKTKFNKEERLNRNLVDRAIMQPCQFDFSILQQEVMLEEKEKKLREENKKLAEEIRKKFKEEKKHQIKTKKIRMKREHRMNKLAGHLISEKVSTDDDKTTENEPVRKPKVRREKKNKPNILEVLKDGSESDSSSDKTSISSCSDNETRFEESGDEIIVDEKPTRYGRIPRKRKTYEPIIESTYRRRKKKEKKEETQKSEEPPKYEPGSIMIVATQGENGEPIYNVMMVTPDQNAEPIQLNQNLFETLTKSIGLQQQIEDSDSTTADLQNIKAQSILKITARPIYEENEDENNDTESRCSVSPSGHVENNITIPADHVENNITICTQNVIERNFK